MKKIALLFNLLALNILNVQAQTEIEVAPPFNIKTVLFVQNNENVTPFFALGESFTFKFDDLYTTEQDYFYTISHCDYNWNPSNLSKSEYLLGFDNVRIQEYENSQNTLQSYSHYTLKIPNFQTKQIKLSGNYILKIFDGNGQLILSRRFVMYENMVGVGLQVKRSRTISDIAHKHNLDFSIKSGNLLLQNPFENVRVTLLQNGVWHSSINNIRPQYNIGTELIYKYDHETSFDASNEYLWFDTKDVRAANNSVYKISSGEVYMTYLYTNHPRANEVYTYFPDVNGNFIVSNVMRENPNLEADYTWVFFALKVPKNTYKEDIYIGGMFNNYALTDEYKLEYNAKEGLYTKAVMVKQGFTNYSYFLADKKGKLNTQDAIDGNFFQTENNYTVLVYYRGTTDLYDRVIGIGRANSENITN